jgi:hypothetical protein
VPFKSFRKDVAAGKPVHLYTAEAGDLDIQVRAAAFGDGNMSVGFSFAVGGPDMDPGVGMVCFDSQWSSEIEPGDEIWIECYEAAFTSTIPITALVRSAPKSSAPA